eukprot:403335448
MSENIFMRKRLTSQKQNHVSDTKFFSHNRKQSSNYQILSKINEDSSPDKGSKSTRHKIQNSINIAITPLNQHLATGSTTKPGEMSQQEIDADVNIFTLENGEEVSAQKFIVNSKRGGPVGKIKLKTTSKRESSKTIVHTKTNSTISFNFSQNGQLNMNNEDDYNVKFQNQLQKSLYSTQQNSAERRLESDLQNQNPYGLNQNHQISSSLSKFASANNNHHRSNPKLAQFTNMSSRLKKMGQATGQNQQKSTNFQLEKMFGEGQREKKAPQDVIKKKNSKSPSPEKFQRRQSIENSTSPTKQQSLNIDTNFKSLTLRQPKIFPQQNLQMGRNNGLMSQTQQYFVTQSQDIFYPAANEKDNNIISQQSQKDLQKFGESLTQVQTAISATAIGFFQPRQELSRLTIQENSSLQSRLMFLSKKFTLSEKQMAEDDMKHSKPRIAAEISLLERLNKKVNLMQLTKEEVRKTYGQLTNKVILQANETLYFKLSVQSKPAPLHIQIQKIKSDTSFNIYYSRVNTMPDAEDNNGEFFNVSFIPFLLILFQPTKLQIQDRHEMSFKNTFMYFTIHSSKGCELLLYAYFNKEKPVHSKLGQSSLADLNIVPDVKKTVSKYKYLNRIQDILNDEMECEEMIHDAMIIKNRRLKEALAKSKANRLNFDFDKLQQILSLKPPSMSLEDFKIEKVMERKFEVDDFHLKKSIFLLNRQEILKEYREKAIKDAKILKKRKNLCKIWTIIIMKKQMFKDLFQTFKIKKAQFILQQKQQESAKKIERAIQKGFKKFGQDYSLRSQKMIKNAFTQSAVFTQPIIEDKAQRFINLLLLHTTQQNQIIHTFRKFIEKIIYIQKVIKVKTSQHKERIEVLHKKWDTCLDQLRFEYIEDKEEKDKLSYNIFRNMKLLSDEARKREINSYYQIVKKTYDMVYFDWRELQKSVHENEIAVLQNNTPNLSQKEGIKSIVDMWQNSAKISNNHLKILGHPIYSIADEFQKQENIRKGIGQLLDLKKGNAFKIAQGKKNKLQQSFFGRYLHLEIDSEKEIHRLYQENDLEDMSIRAPPKLKYIPSDIFMKCLILKYVESTLI